MSLTGVYNNYIEGTDVRYSKLHQIIFHEGKFEYMKSNGEAMFIEWLSGAFQVDGNQLTLCIEDGYKREWDLIYGLVLRDFDYNSQSLSAIWNQNENSIFLYRNDKTILLHQKNIKQTINGF